MREHALDAPRASSEVRRRAIRSAQAVKKCPHKRAFVVTPRCGRLFERTLNRARAADRWYTEIGELNQVVHIWAYERLDDRIKRCTALYEDPDWLETFVPKAFPMLEKMESKLLRPAAFSPIR
jgi:hypothetical protein